MPHCTEHVVEYRGDGGFSVCSCYTYQPELLRGVTIECRGYLSRGIFRVVHAYDRDALRYFDIFADENCSSTQLSRLSNVLVAVAYGTDEFQGRVRAVANLWGFVHDLDILENACVPILSFQSEKDPVVPYREGRPIMTAYTYGTWAIHQKAIALGIPSQHHPCPEKGHRLHLDKAGALTPMFYEIRDAMASFFAKY